MKAIAIVELPNDAFDDEAWGDGKWMIDDEGAIRYKEDDAWVHYKDIDIDGIELRPLPKKKSASNKSKIETSFEYVHGFNDCIRETTGETE